MACPARSRSASRQPGNFHPSTGWAKAVAPVRFLGRRCGPQRAEKRFRAAGGCAARPDPSTRRPAVYPQGLLSRRGADERAGASSDDGRQEPSRRWTSGSGSWNGCARATWPTATCQCLAGAAERLRYSEEFRNALLEGLDADLVEQYFSETGSNFKPRPSFSLPWSATPECLPPGRDFLVRLKPHVDWS